MVVELEFGADLWILELVELGVANGDERIVRKDILDIAGDDFGATE